MKYIRTNSLKRLFSIKRRSLEEEAKTPNGSIGEETIGLKNVEETEAPQRPIWKCFSYEEISVATDCFSSENLVGKGGYAEVYRGILTNGEEIAVKRLTKAVSDERKEKEFLTEIGTIGHVCHPNVLSLMGCCMDNGLYLIFKFSSRGSVASLLHDENLPPMEWKTRYKIAIGTARGLNYLHEGCQRRIIHRDIKSSNVLLTTDFEPLISDFGLAKWLPSQWTHHSIGPIEGTFGHLAPEYYMHGIVDEKTDVFAFGVLLLEIISGRKPVDGSYQSLHTWAKPILKQGEIEDLVDPKLEGSYDVTQLKRLAFAASLCIRAAPKWRPTISKNQKPANRGLRPETLAARPGALAGLRPRSLAVVLAGCRGGAWGLRGAAGGTLGARSGPPMAPDLWGKRPVGRRRVRLRGVSQIGVKSGWIEHGSWVGGSPVWARWSERWQRRDRALPVLGTSDLGGLPGGAPSVVGLRWPEGHSRVRGSPVFWASDLGGLVAVWLGGAPSTEGLRTMVVFTGLAHGMEEV